MNPIALILPLISSFLPKIIGRIRGTNGDELSDLLGKNQNSILNVVKPLLGGDKDGENLLQSVIPLLQNSLKGMSGDQLGDIVEGFSLGGQQGGDQVIPFLKNLDIAGSFKTKQSDLMPVDNSIEERLHNIETVLFKLMTELKATKVIQESFKV